MVWKVKRSVPFIIGAIESPSNNVIRGERTFCAAFDKESRTSHSLRRLPNMSIPTKAAESGAIREHMIVTAIGNTILVNLDTSPALYVI